MQTVKDKLLDYRYLMLVALLLLSFIIYNIGNTYNGNDDLLTRLFFFHYICAVIAFIARALMNKKERKGFMTPVLLLFLVSAYGLNRVMNIFHENTPWFSVLLVISGINLLLFHYYENLPRSVRAIMCFILGISVVLFIYLSCYLLPVYGMAVPAILALGISVHAFIPILALIHIWHLFYTHIRDDFKAGRWSVLSGFVFSLVVIVVFTMAMNSEVRQLNRIYNRTSAEGVSALPPWVVAANQMDGSWIEERVLKAEFIYILSDWFDWDFFDRSLRNFNDSRLHDPLMVIASGFVPKIIPSDEERIKILEALFDARHEGQERLWSGDDLYTDYVNTKARIWPKLHLAYTEKVITVVNNNGDSWRPQEAIYTFHLPEGCVVTSLSLWINGKEEKGILTTKEKADTAYKQIVGVESRDPSLVRWQEGNTVSVRVFPVTTKAARQFKIGFTAPLKAGDKELVYENIYFDGPSPAHATEDGTIEFATTPGTLSLPDQYESEGMQYRKEGNYKADWKVTIEKEDIQPHTFSFNGKGYSIKPYVLQRDPVLTNAVYLDINEAWSEKEINEVLQLVGTTPVYVWSGERMVLVDKKVLKNLQKQHFSLFPLYKIKDPANALLITKSTPISPSLDELEGSRFKTELSTWLSQDTVPKIRLLDLGEQLSPYLKSLKEFRVFRYEKGGILLLKILMDTKTFAGDIESDNKVVIDQANIEIEQSADSVTRGDAPDHLMRLFAYNHILQKAGKGLITKSEGQDSLVSIAREAYVVSPISSLIVLESKEDYDRFNIKDSDNSLKNASMKSNGAVPEPHEWALIILVLFSITYVKLRPKWIKVNA
ncbi:XrtN system VIT domain-containing protein [Chitinophaga sp. SYP-B3965]|uniref:XrtN system VIT domain-containing protein n=1 Tax=Chitinophaga sp. SYP-B3965 TaxID=2663120 RepID=UPI00156320C4|nr:XrtN system VIT domain-containing protein [Chitinophaga sp. SYP-B3965]